MAFDLKKVRGIRDFFPEWESLSDAQRKTLEEAAALQKAPCGAVLHAGDKCTGLMLVCSGRLRVFTLSPDGREMTLYRLLEGDICLFSASCAVKGLSLELSVSAEENTVYWLIPAEKFRAVMQESAALSNFTSRLLADRFSEVMWLMEQLLWKRMDQRLAGFLLEQSALDGTYRLKLTHERIASHLGTAREVVTRMLKYFQREGAVRLSRGTVELCDMKKLQKYAK